MRVLAQVLAQVLALVPALARPKIEGFLCPQTTVSNRRTGLGVLLINLAPRTYSKPSFENGLPDPRMTVSVCPFEAHAKPQELEKTPRACLHIGPGIVGGVQRLSKKVAVKFAQLRPFVVAVFARQPANRSRLLHRAKGPHPREGIGPPDPGVFAHNDREVEINIVADKDPRGAAGDFGVYGVEGRNQTVAVPRGAFGRDSMNRRGVRRNGEALRFHQRVHRRNVITLGVEESGADRDNPVRRIHAGRLGVEEKIFGGHKRIREPMNFRYFAVGLTSSNASKS